MDLVYICRNGENEELRYSIRSAVANLPHDKIWVVGGKPDWYTGNHIPVPQDKDKYTNARENMKKIAEPYGKISSNFILMNDDFFIMKPVEDLQYYYTGTLADRIKLLQRKHRRSHYINMLMHTLRELQKMGISEPLDYTLHVPFIMNKVNLRKIVKNKMSWRLAYGNIFNVGGIQAFPDENGITDVKYYVRQNKLSGPNKNTLSETFMSTEDRSFEYMLPRLQELFPEPSKFESV